ncbi:hypothetical protein BHE74_00035196, partial [Ensete ventricosum]
ITLLAAGLAASGRPLRTPCSRLPLRAGRSRPCPRVAAASMGDSPYRLALTAFNRLLAGGLAMVGHPCKGSGHGQLPL